MAQGIKVERSLELPSAAGATGSSLYGNGAREASAFQLDGGLQTRRCCVERVMDGGSEIR